MIKVVHVVKYDAPEGKFCSCFKRDENLQWITKYACKYFFRIGGEEEAVCSLFHSFLRLSPCEEENMEMFKKSGACLFAEIKGENDE